MMKQDTIGHVLLVAAATICCGILAWRTLSLGRHVQEASIVQSRKGTKNALYTYSGENIKWAACGQVDNCPLECSSIEVPKDHFSINNFDNETFNIPLVRMRGKNATQNLLVNPGGPGGSGFAFMYDDALDIMDVIDESFHLLSFDPRGVNSSRPLATCYPDQGTRKRLSEIRATDPSRDSPDVYAWTANFVHACADTMGEAGRYINTPQTAADMNNILDAVRQDDMRVIIDGIANHFDWYGALIEGKDFIDTDKVLYGIFDECVKAGSNCTLSALADNSEELYRKFLDLTAKIRAEPISVYINSTLYGVLDYHSLWFNGGIRPRPSWPMDLGIHLKDGPSGPKYWPQGRTNLLDKLLPWYGNSSFAFAQNKLYYAKQQWRIPRTHGFVPRIDVETAHPLLVLSMTFDPVCPLASARVGAESFRGSRLVEVKGYGHCSQAMKSSCAVAHIRNFLQEGVLPDTHVQCEVDNEYYVKPE
ncbi:uncharacterized protein GIQ15_06372 [Arthroderma uncinatum]|uniref:uncharacterized protein n=1 Tax=Arthroderma uncinatum TaxID=74035 RepID=UPI00144AE1B0|nr:uncharacterized protein GIQ15_06372 [Arthroderma uncinatum]KAF3481025.1 hypothetical protein GIQ15_06372 [Arthroderma uncinatum]